MMRSGGGGEPTIQPSLTGSVLSAVGMGGGVAKAGAGAGVWACGSALAAQAGDEGSGQAGQGPGGARGSSSWGVSGGLVVSQPS